MWIASDSLLIFVWKNCLVSDDNPVAPALLKQIVTVTFNSLNLFFKISVLVSFSGIEYRVRRFCPEKMQYQFVLGYIESPKPRKFKLGDFVLTSLSFISEYA